MLEILAEVQAYGAGSHILIIWQFDAAAAAGRGGGGSGAMLWAGRKDRRHTRTSSAEY